MIQLPQPLHDAMTRVNFATFVARAMDTLEPAARYEANWHIDTIAY